jgi:hypothetical protein
MTTQKKKSTPKKSAPVKKATTKKTTTKKAAPKKSPAKKSPAKKAPAKKAPAKKNSVEKAVKAVSPVIKVTKTTTTSSNPDIKVSFNAAPIHTAVDKTVDNISVVINDIVDDFETVMENINLVFPDEVKKLSFFKRIFRLKK